jgi:hypothetical protein
VSTVLRIARRSADVYWNSASGGLALVLTPEGYVLPAHPETYGDGARRSGTRCSGRMAMCSRTNSRPIGLALPSRLARHAASAMMIGWCRHCGLIGESAPFSSRAP